ncbi:MAG: 50S ribosomal protein L6, partial [Acidimicrobiia bacterium]
MSRIGKMPIAVPGGVEVTVAGRQVEVKGPKGTLSRSFHERVTVSVEDGAATVDRVDETREAKALHGLSRALLANMVTGVSEGFSRELQIVGVGYRALPKGSDLELQVGFSHPVQVVAPDGITFEVPEPTRVVVRG